MSSPAPVNLAERLARFDDRWSPKAVGHFNGHELMLVKAEGEFVRHAHPDTDDFFHVLKGRLTIEMDDGDVTLGPGEVYVVPKGVAHRPVAHGVVHMLLIEPVGTPNTADEATASVRTSL